MGDPESFAGRTAVVTGAGGGMGLQIALDLKAAGALVAGIDVKERPTELADAPYFRGDVSDERFVGAAIGRAFAAGGRLDYLVNAAGILLFGQDRSLVEVDLAVWNRVLAINLTGCMLTARHAIPCMQKSGGGRWCISPRSSACAATISLRTPIRWPRPGSWHCPSRSRSSSRRTTSAPT
jgi:NAD(P)-dependent dehydrogenase (short-subunit alcohol dehydrogenase family)